jgi:hypothetical protein
MRTAAEAWVATVGFAGLVRGRAGPGPVMASGAGRETGGTASPPEAHAATSKTIATRPSARARWLPIHESMALLNRGCSDDGSHSVATQVLRI